MSIDEWAQWEPTERATLCFIRRENEVLLILKKRGLGAGKINAPGGRLELGETPLQAAIRETQEEVGVTPHHPEAHGELHFDFVDGYRLHCVVFVAWGCDGEPVETPEADPMWFPVDAIPYDAMWEDDAHWLPGILEGRVFTGYFRFDGEKMLDSVVLWDENPMLQVTHAQGVNA